MPVGSSLAPGDPPAERGIDTALPSQGLAELRDQLDALLTGKLGEGVPASRLFVVPLTDPVRVERRIAELEAQRVSLSSRMAEAEARLEALAGEEAEALRERAAVVEAESEAAAVKNEPAPDAVPVVPNDDSADAAAESGDVEAAAALAAAEAEAAATAAAELAARTAARRDFEQRADGRDQDRQNSADLLRDLTLDLDIAEKRYQFLTKWEKRLTRMSSASRQILPSLSDPRGALRNQAEVVGNLSLSLVALVERIDRLEARGRAGLLVGFVSEQRSLVAELSESARSYRAEAARTERLGNALSGLAVRLEAEGRGVAEQLYRESVRSGGGRVIDQLFESHLQMQRQLRKGISDVLTAPVAGAFATLAAEAEGRIRVPESVATTRAARAVLEEGLGHRQRIDAVLEAGRAGLRDWELAFENEMVSVLGEQATEEARSRAYGLSNEVLSDVRSELALAWTRFREGLEVRRAAVPSFSALVNAKEGRVYLYRILSLLGIAGAWLLLRRQAGSITVSIVRVLRKLPAFKGRMGLLVRASGLVQSILPPLFLFVAIAAARYVLGQEAPLSRLLYAVLFPLAAYWFGRELLLGATRRITPGRPALIEVRPWTLARLSKTYATLGLVIAIAAILDGVARIAIGAGRLASLVAIVVVAWVAVWAVWEAVRWRVPLAEAWGRLLPAAEPEAEPSIESRLSSWMEESKLGFLLSPAAMLRVALTPIVGAASGLASGTSLVKSLRARLLRRRSKSSEPTPEKKSKEVPEAYLESFPLHPVLGENDALILPRQEILDEVFDQLKRWQETRKDGSLVLVGEKGAGKTTIAAQVGRKISETAVQTVTIQGKPTTAEALVEAMGASLGFESIRSARALTDALCEGDDRVVLVDEAHNVFLRKVDGFQAYDALVDLVNSTSSKVFWILIFNSFTWRFLNETRGRVHYFRKLLPIPQWSAEEIQELIRVRNKETGFELEFDEVLLSDEKVGSAGFELIEEADGYFRLLWESSGGNPRIATKLWLSSLAPYKEGVLRVGMFRDPSTEVLSELQDDLIFALAAVCQHENLSAKELAVVLNVSEEFARFATQFLMESGFLDRKDALGERVTLSAAYYRVVLKVLKNKHLLFA
ncbi:MAG: ATP-binding protein [Myxococcota bacterium]